jgi:formate dehydrogenase subunit delta
MQIDKLVRMANQIGAFFDADPERAAAIEGVTSHLCRFWEPRMRRQLIVWVDETGGNELMPVVREAIATHRERITPKNAA